MWEQAPFFRFHSGDWQPQTLAALCAVMLVAGLLSLLYGFRLYRVVVVAATGLVGAYLGWRFLAPRLGDSYSFLAPLGLGLVGALAALPVQRVMVFLAGAAVGFVSLGPVVAEVIWSGPEGPTPTHYLVTGAVAFLVMGILALVLFKPVVYVATSMFGATLVVSAVVHLVEAFSRSHGGLYQQYPRELAWTFAGVAVVGVVFQTATKKKQKPAQR